MLLVAFETHVGWTLHENCKKQNQMESTAETALHRGWAQLQLSTARCGRHGKNNLRYFGDKKMKVPTALARAKEPADGSQI